jgi:hypothetical protein
VEVLASSTDVVRNRVDFQVIAYEQVAAAAIEDRYGRGTVQLTAALEPVE